MQRLSEPSKVLLIYLSHSRDNRSDVEIGVTELWHLVETLGNARIVDLVHQKGEEFDKTYIGPGKTKEIAQYLQNHTIDIIIFNGQLKPSQKFTLMKLFWEARPNILIWDRIDLILAIFTKHARTTEAKLQIKLAQMQSMGPRIYGMGMVLSRQGGGIGGRGIGETNTELMKRHWKREMKRAKEQLAHAASARERQMAHRKNIGLKTISIVGYTNAGKTSLFNVLTHKKKLVENALFATLDSSVAEMYMPSLAAKVLISDTIGFIANLPPALIEAFKSTLMESVHADVILHVVDMSDPLMKERIAVVNKILDSLQIPMEKEILVFNKVDAASDAQKENVPATAGTSPYVVVSTKTQEGIDRLTTQFIPTAMQLQK